MLRRDFIAGLGGAVLWPAVARLQPAELPLIGFLHEASAESYAANAAAFAEGLKQGGFAEARDLAVDYRFAGGDDGAIGDGCRRSGAKQSCTDRRGREPRGAGGTGGD